MALSLGVKAGSRISIGGKVLEVVDVPDPQEIVVSVLGGPHVTLTTARRELLLPEVYACCGVSDFADQNVGYSRIAFEAPKRIRIERVPNERDEPIAA